MSAEIFRIAYQLNAAGKNPSVALVRARLTTSIPLPHVIQALQHWRANPQLGQPTGSTEPAQPTPSETVTADVELNDDRQQINQLNQRVSQLEQQLQQVFVRLDQLSGLDQA